MNTLDTAPSAPHAIASNPFRILGLAANASEREIQKQVRTLTRYAEIGRSKEVDFDLPFLGPVVRSIDTIREAASQIEHSQQRVVHSLFWFLKRDSFDEIALKHLNQDGIGKARSIWHKVSNNNQVSDRSLTAMYNLGTLDLIEAFSQASEARQDRLASALHGKGELFEPENLQTLTLLIGGRVVDASQVIKSWTGMILDEASGSSRAAASDLGTLFDAFRSYPDAVLKEIEEHFTASPKRDVEVSIRKCEESREANPSEAHKAASALFVASGDPLRTLQCVWGRDNLKYQLLSDGVSEELLICGMAYFQAHNETDFDPGEDVKRVFAMASKRAVGESMQHQIAENQQGLQVWLDQAESRARQQSVKTEIADIEDSLKQFGQQMKGMDQVTTLLQFCMPKLRLIELTLGKTDSFYLMVSDAVAFSAMGMMVSVVNEYQERAVVMGGRIEDFERLVQHALVNIRSILTMHLNAEARQVALRHSQTLEGMGRQVKAVRSKSGCYIATMAYGDHEHPDVRVLRRFRDEYLFHSPVGRAFVSWYYRHAPSWTARLRKVTPLHWVIRQLLRVLVWVLPK